MEPQEYTIARSLFDQALERTHEIADDFDRHELEAERASLVVAMVSYVRNLCDSARALLRLGSQVVNDGAYNAQRIRGHINDTHRFHDSLVDVRRLRRRVLDGHEEARAVWTDELDRDIAELITSHEVALADFSKTLNAGPSPEDERRRLIRRTPSAFPRSAAGLEALYYTPTPDDVVDFVVQHDLDKDLTVTLAVIQKTFPNARDLRLEIDGDREGVETWLLLRFTTSADGVDESLEAYWDMMNRVVPIDQADKLRLVYRLEHAH